MTFAVMTKFPEAGKVKTRLTPDLSPPQAAEVHRIFLVHVVQRLAKLAPSLRVIVDPPDKLGAMQDVLGMTDLLPQCDGDLGCRLASAVEAIGAFPILFFGIDSPDLPLSHIHKAATLLEHRDVVVGPSEDGGYWCLGLSSRVDPGRLLCDIHWSSGQEREQTLARAKALGYTTAIADAWDDVDRRADLKRLCTRLAGSEDPENRKLLESLRFLPKDVLP
jgi:uncharacterized protein